MQSQPLAPVPASTSTSLFGTSPQQQQVESLSSQQKQTILQLTQNFQPAQQQQLLQIIQGMPPQQQASIIQQMQSLSPDKLLALLE